MRNNYERITSRSRAGKRVTMIAAGARNEGGDGGAGCCALGAFTLAEMRAGFVVFEVVVVLIQLALNSQDFHPLLEASPDSPGVRLRLFRSGISYLSKVASNVLAEQLPRLFIPDVEHRLPRDQGVIYITRMKISRFIGDLSGAVNIVVPFNLTGQAEIQAQGLSVQLDSAIESTANGSARVSTISCHSTIRSVDVMNHNGGLFGLTRLHLTPSTPGVSQFLRTTCESSFCIADLIPQLTESYPNRDLELSIISTRAPAVLFSEKKGGVISVNLAGVVVIFVLEGLRRKQLVVLDAEVVADARLNLQQQNVSGSVELTKFELASRSATVKISREELSDTSILVSHLLQNMLNDLLTSGFPLPLPKVIRLHNVAVDVLSRRILLRTNISVDERRLSRIAARTIFNSPEFGRRLNDGEIRKFTG
ncbi:hypothetical protein Angca_004101 [Angiostrongylus cantonensis]|nr:hypothetical protein Angca_004101 [Angiostrongylus cantonensis]